MPVLFLNEAEVKSLLTMEMALDAVETGLRKMALEEAFNIPRSRCQTDQTMLHVLSASAKTLGVLGLKAYTTNRRGARFHVTLYDAKTGEMLSILQADWLGRFRTGAASGVATKFLARPDAQVLCILGSGKQALTQALAVAKVRPLSEIRVYSPNQSNRERFATELHGMLNLPVAASNSAEEAVRGSHIVCTITASREPVLLGEWLSPGMHLNIAGSNFLGKTEIDLEVIQRSRPLVIDHKEQGRIEAGDFVEALNQQAMTWSEVTELSRIIANRDPGREHPEQITLFKSVGIAVEDIALGMQVYLKAKAQNLGTWLDL